MCSDVFCGREHAGGPTDLPGLRGAADECGRKPQWRSSFTDGTIPTALKHTLCHRIAGALRVMVTSARGAQAPHFVPSVLETVTVGAASPHARVRRAGTLHLDLRHTAAGLAISAGGSPKAVQKMLGHASAAMTLDVYARLFDQDAEDLGARLWALAVQTDERGDMERSAHHALTGGELVADKPAGLRAVNAR